MATVAEKLNIATWFEIPVKDMQRAAQYEDTEGNRLALHSMK